MKHCRKHKSNKQHGRGCWKLWTRWCYQTPNPEADPTQLQRHCFPYHLLMQKRYTLLGFLKHLQSMFPFWFIFLYTTASSQAHCSSIPSSWDSENRVTAGCTCLFSPPCRNWVLLAIKGGVVSNSLAIASTDSQYLLLILTLPLWRNWAAADLLLSKNSWHECSCDLQGVHNPYWETLGHFCKTLLFFHG